MRRYTAPLHLTLVVSAAVIRGGQATATARRLLLREVGWRVGARRGSDVIVCARSRVADEVARERRRRARKRLSL